MAPYLCSRQWTWLACAADLFGRRGMSSLGEAMEAYFEPASKLRPRSGVLRTLYVLRAWTRPARNRDERVFTAVGTWVSRAFTTP